MNLEPSARIHRHALPARLMHAAVALVVVVLLVTGYALADALPGSIVHWLGGHALASDGHDALGLAFAVAGMGMLVLRWRSTAGWLRELCQVRRGDFIWLQGFVRNLLGREPPAWHTQRLDPLQRWVLALIIVLTAVASASGVALYVMPPGWREAFVVAVRLHMGANAALAAAVLLHAFAGSGALPTHHGLASSMWGDGAVPLATARRLWPGWTAACKPPSSHEVPGSVPAKEQRPIG